MGGRGLVGEAERPLNAVPPTPPSSSSHTAKEGMRLPPTSERRAYLAATGAYDSILPSFEVDPPWGRRGGWVADSNAPEDRWLGQSPGGWKGSWLPWEGHGFL